METERGQVLSAAGSRISHFYFVDRGMISQVRSMRDGNGVEIGAVGNEGMVPAGAIWDVEYAVLESVVQIPGSVLRIRRDDLKRGLYHESDLLQLMRSYTGVALSQLVQTAACNILHSVEQRFCRWLLCAHDSAGKDTFVMTHEFIGIILGVRRASVSIAAQRLQRSGIIRYSHGSLTITNRRDLERAACECYETMRSELDELFSRSYAAYALVALI
jgi:CRP-like cAMP-binding protein